MSYCDDILAKSRALGLDECEVISIQKKIITVRITDSEIAEIKQNQENSVAVRVIDKKRIISGRSSGEEKNFLEKVLEAKTLCKTKEFLEDIPISIKVFASEQNT